MIQIPKIIHYCWFGQKKLPASALRCIESWKRFAPGFTLRLWNETNFDIETAAYTAEAYRAGKYAFVSDVARLYALSAYGGLYLDTDVELLRSPEELVAGCATIGFESSGLISTAVISAEKGNSLIQDFFNTYNSTRFILPNGYPDLTPNTRRLTDFMIGRGLKTNGKEQFVESFRVLPSRMLSPLNQEGYRLDSDSDTICIHHFESSWQTTPFRLRRKVQKLIGPDATIALIRAKRFFSSL